MAGALGLREAAGRPPAEAVREALAGKRLLLVLDNLEQVAAAPFVGELLASSPTLGVLATSRLPLRLRAEREYPVPPLTLPPVNAASPEESSTTKRCGSSSSGRKPSGPGSPYAAERPGGGGDQPAAGRAAAGDRAGGGTGTGLPAGDAAGAARETAAAPDRRSSRRSGPATDAAQRHRLELRPADIRGADPLPAAGGLRWRGALGAVEVVADPEGSSTSSAVWTDWSSTTCCSRSRGRMASHASPCWRRFGSTGWSGWSRAAKQRRRGGPMPNSSWRWWRRPTPS